MQNKKPPTAVIIPGVVAVFLILGSFVALTYIAPQASGTAQPPSMVLSLLFSVFAIAVVVIAVYESRLRFNVDPNTV